MEYVHTVLHLFVLLFDDFYFHLLHVLLEVLGSYICPYTVNDEEAETRDTSSSTPSRYQSMSKLMIVQ